MLLTVSVATISFWLWVYSSFKATQSQYTRWSQFSTENFQNRQKMMVSARTKGIYQFFCESWAITLKPHYVFCVRLQRIFTFLLDSSFFQSVFPSCPLPPPFFFVRKLIICFSPTSAPLAEPGAIHIIMMNHKLWKNPNPQPPSKPTKQKKSPQLKWKNPHQNTKPMPKLVLSTSCTLSF